MHPGTAIGIRDAIARSALTAERAVTAALERIAREDPALNAFISICAERALTRARALDQASAPTGPLHGVPVAIKDTIAVRGVRLTAGSRVLGDYVAAYDATVVARLESAGAVIVGKTNCDEFAMGSSTEHSAFGPSRHPRDPGRTPGGSSGGSAVAVAVGMAPIALGSDTGGSVRQPAALCGVVGARPTYGRVSRYGLIAFASSLDQVGPLATTVADAALVQDVIAGPDPKDATCVAAATACSAAIGQGVRGLRVGVPRHLLEAGVAPDVLAAFEASLEALARLGVEIDTVELPHSRHAIAVYYLVATAEASSNLARYDGVRYGACVEADSIADLYARTRSAGFGAEVKRRIMLGTYALSAGYAEAFYLKAQAVRRLIQQDFVRALAGRQAIALPTSPTTAFRLGERVADPLQMYLSDVFTVGPSLAGLPSISVPMGTAADGLPVGLQLTGRAWDDAMVYRLAHALHD